MSVGAWATAAAAPQAVLVCSETGAIINLTQWDYAGPVQGRRDGDMLDLGTHRLRLLETPNVHHWDSMIVCLTKRPVVCFRQISSSSQAISQPSYVRI